MCVRVYRCQGEDPWSITSILINALGSMAKAWNFEGERRLRAGNVVPGQRIEVHLKMEHMHFNVTRR